LTSIIQKRKSLHRNLTRQQQQNSDLECQINQLQPLANIGTAACMIAHEINNLLTPLANFANLALNNPDDKLLTEKALEKMVRNCEQASKVVESMLAVANGQSQEKKNTSLAVLVDEVFTCLCRDFAKDSILVKITIPEDLQLWAVPVQIQQVLMNLILNAREAMLPRGGILTVTARETDESVQIEVADTGVGITPADIKRIFEPFYTSRTDKKSPSKESGSGLGLVFCKKIVDSHGGSISVESEPSRGSTFRITLPKSQ